MNGSGRGAFPAERTANAMALRMKKVAGVAAAREGEMNDMGGGRRGRHNPDCVRIL